MYLRTLTDEEISRLGDAKGVANKKLTVQRQIVTKALKKVRLGRDEKEELERKLEALEPITGHPAKMVVGDRSIFLDYDLVKKINLSLARSRYTPVVAISKNNQGRPAMIIDYFKGVINLYELSTHKTELLNYLPTVEING